MAAAPTVGPVPTLPRFVRISPGVYDSVDGRLTLYRIEGCRPAAWNVEWTIDYENWLVDHDDDAGVWSLAYTNIVDGAGSKRDALALLPDEWPRFREYAARIEANSPWTTA